MSVDEQTQGDHKAWCAEKEEKHFSPKSSPKNTIDPWVNAVMCGIWERKAEKDGRHSWLIFYTHSYLKVVSHFKLDSQTLMSR